MVENVDTPALTGARRGDCLVEAIVMAVSYFLVSLSNNGIYGK